MANMLDELDEKIMEEGREVNVIAKQIKVEKDASIQILIWALYLIGLGLIAFGAVKKIYYIIPVGIIIPAYVYSTLKKQESYFSQLEQRVQQSASQIDNYLEQRVIVLQNTVKLVEKAIDLDKSVFSEISKLRSGSTIKESERNDIQDKLDKVYRGLNIAVENVGIWNREIFEWPFKKYVASKKEYTTRIPFIASQETKLKAKEVFF